MSIVVEQVNETPAKERALTKRSIILRQAARLAKERGGLDWTLDELARAIGIAKGTVYLYFETKLEILQALLCQEIERWLILSSGQVAFTTGERDLADTLWREASNRPVLMALAGKVPIATNSISQDAVRHFAAQLSIPFGHRQGHAAQMVPALVAALIGAVAVSGSKLEAAHGTAGGDHLFAVLLSGLLAG